jgi:hypothetical protein
MESNRSNVYYKFVSPKITNALQIIESSRILSRILGLRDQ